MFNIHFSNEAEQAVLGCLLLKNSAWNQIKNKVTANDFYQQEYRLIFTCIEHEAANNRPFDILTLSDRLRASSRLEEVGGEAFLFELAKNTPTAANVEAYAEIVRDRSIKRQLISVGEGIPELLKGQKDTPTIINEIISQLENLQFAHAQDDIGKACLNYDELIIADIKPKVMLLPWLVKGGIAMVWAERGLGKTQFSLSLAYAVTSSNEFMRWPILNNTGVLIVDGEMMLSDIRERLTSFSPAKPKLPLVLLSHERFYAEYEHDLVITEPTTQAALLQYLDRQPDIGLIVLDNLSSLSRIKEDKSDDWRNIMLPFLIACRRRSVAVLLVHHAGKNKEQRGTGAREDQLDASIHLAKVDSENNGAKFSVNFTKTRGCFGDVTRPFIAELIKDQNHMQWRLSSAEENTKARLLNLIAECGKDGITAKEAAIELEISQAQISKYRKALIAESLILDGKRGSPLIISLMGSSLMKGGGLNTN